MSNKVYIQSSYIPAFHHPPGWDPIHLSRTIKIILTGPDFSPRFSCLWPVHPCWCSRQASACEVLEQGANLHQEVWFGTEINSWLSTHLLLCLLHYPEGWQRSGFPSLHVGLAACTPGCCASFSSALRQVSHALLEQTKGCSKRASRESTCQQGEMICRDVKQIRIFLILFPTQNRGCSCSSLQCPPQGDICEYILS